MPDGERRVRPWREVGFAVAAVLLGGLFFLTPRAPEESALLDAFLREGPADGRWRIDSFLGSREVLVGEEPRDPRCRRVAVLDAAGGLEEVHVVPRSRTAQLFVPGCRERFRKNYEVRERHTVEDGGVAWREAVWRPRLGDHGETSRRIWIHPQTGLLHRLEDRAANGETIREVVRLADLPASGLPEPPDEAHATRDCLERAAKDRRHRPSYEEVRARAPFRLLRPARLPAGFGLKEAVYHEDGVAAGVAWLSYTDGLAGFALAMGPSDRIRAFEARVEKRGQGGERGAGDEDAGPCPSKEGTCRVRRHHDPRRTVLRVDDLHGLSVILMSRNELLERQYLEVIRSLRPLPD